MKPAIPIAAAIAVLHAGALARQAPATGAVAATPPKVTAEQPAPGDVIRVDINGAPDYDPRRDDTASKTVIGQQEILKYGDTNVFDVLKRAPGVTVIGESIRMRGLGNGYTQVLVNGERPAPGFTLQSVAPEQIEKIEVVRAATAEFSTQAIAGTINIVLKKVVSKAQRDLRFNVTDSGQGRSALVFGTLADRSGKLSYYLNAMALRGLGHERDQVTEQWTAPDGTLLQLRDSRSRNDSRLTTLMLAPRLNWKLAGNGQLNWNATFNVNHFDGDNGRTSTDRAGLFPEPNFVYRDGTSSSRSVYGETSLNWITPLAGGKLDTTVGASHNSADSASAWRSSTANRARVLQRSNDSATGNTRVRSAGKYTRTLFGDHALVTGWEASRHETREDRHRVEGLGGVTPAVFDERFAPVVVQAAAYLQDEWNVSRLWSMYLGARWETIRTDSAVSGVAATRTRNRVLSPIAQTLYKFPDGSGRQLRLALTRTFKAPTTLQLTARRNESDFNTRFAPDSSGNPALQPELATGVDLTYEHFWAPAAMFAVSASQRRISGYIRTLLAHDGQGRWLNRPVNDGTAHVRSLGVELKLPSKLWWPALPALDLRANVHRNWSRVASVPGPHNVLDQQIPLTASVGVDHKRGPYTMGANLALRTGGPVRISAEQSTHMQAVRELEMYLLYKINPVFQVRVTGSNLLARDNQSGARYVDADGASDRWQRADNSPRVLLNLEFKL